MKAQLVKPNCFGLALHSTTEVLEITIAQIMSSAQIRSGEVRSNKVTNTSISESLSDNPSSNSSNAIVESTWHSSWHLGRELSSQIHPCLAEMLAEPEMDFAWSNLAWLAVAKGIGSFTSTRVGIVLIRTLAEQLDLPVYAFDCESISLNAQNMGLPLGISLFNLANQQWRAQQFPDWREALPLYGGDFGA